MKILSIFWGLCSGAALYDDGKIVAAVSEERFTREKNDSSFPQNSINWIFESTNTKSDNLDYVTVVSNDVGIDYIILSKHKWNIEDYLFENNNYWKPRLLNNDYSQNLIFDVMKHKINCNQYPEVYWKEKMHTKDFTLFQQESYLIIAEFLGISPEKIKKIEHHKSHALYSYYSSGFQNKKVLAFTADGWGDGKNATISIIDENGHYTLLQQSSNCNIARVYRYMTLLLGMKPSEHEFKVMGLAPYGRQAYAQKALDILRETLYIDGLEFKSKVTPTDSYYWFKERFEGIRFDNLAWALQKWTEELLCKWVENSIEQYKIHDIVFSGGVSMNVKAMGEVAKLNCVSNIFVGGSAGDESHVISTPYCFVNEMKLHHTIQPLNNLYLGCEYTKNEEFQAIQNVSANEFIIIENYENKEVAQLLYNGKIIARSVDKMEFGQRALGNRSILADPSQCEIKDKINSAIKNRDFWMPFAPIILDKYAHKYIHNPKNISAPYMTVTFDTTEVGYKSMQAACHPSDKTCRAQILKFNQNPKLYNLLEEFEKLSGRGALMNTSFNLHGYPIVTSPQDAIYVFQNSDLDALILNNYLLIKREK